jgi:diguanylate cyclase (GGDEF)-like protein
MNINLLPDLAAMATLLAILQFLRRRHPQEGVGLWITGLLFIFLEALAHAFYASKGPLHVPSHMVALDSYLAAGIIFLAAASKDLFPRRPTLIYLLSNSLALVALETVYSLDVRNPLPYQVTAVCGLAIGVITPFFLARSVRLGRMWWLVLSQGMLWGSVWIYASDHLFRDAAYFPLFLLYLAVAVVFALSLPRKSLGRIAIVAGFTLWAFVFLAHSWVSSHPKYTSVAAEIWDWQKFLVTIGMLLVLLERQVESNEWFALHDQLTGLPNRRCFEQRLDESIELAARNGTRAAILMIDLNGFKIINDSRGHETGDRLLQHIAQSLRHAIRTTDTLARLGGDEFIIVATDLPADISVTQITEMTSNRVLEALQKPFTNGSETFSVGGSVGVAIYPDDTTDEILLRRLADQRMYQQKRVVPVLSVQG